MIKQRIFFICFAILLWAPPANAALIRGYDTFHHGISISSPITLHEDIALKKIYFRKIIGWDSTQYKLSAYDKEYHSLLGENDLLILTLNQETAYRLTPEKAASAMRLHPFYETELSSTDIVLSPEVIDALKDAAAAELTFSFDGTNDFTYTLTPKQLDEWKKIIVATK